MSGYGPVLPSDRTTANAFVPRLMPDASVFPRIADQQVRRGCGTPLEALVESEAGQRAESGFTVRSRPISEYQAFLRKV
jgi:hypothetical protein